MSEERDAARAAWIKAGGTASGFSAHMMDSVPQHAPSQQEQKMNANERVRALIQEWRETAIEEKREGEGWHDGFGEALRYCATDLEFALANTPESAQERAERVLEVVAKYVGKTSNIYRWIERDLLAASPEPPTAAEFKVTRPDGTSYRTDIGGAEMASKRDGYLIQPAAHEGVRHGGRPMTLRECIEVEDVHPNGEGVFSPWNACCYREQCRENVRRLAQPVGEVDEAIRFAGAMLANCAFNLAQCERLTERERRSLDESRKAWDEALRPATNDQVKP